MLQPVGRRDHPLQRPLHRERKLGVRVRTVGAGKKPLETNVVGRRDRRVTAISDPVQVDRERPREPACRVEGHEPRLVLLLEHRQQRPAQPCQAGQVGTRDTERQPPLRDQAAVHA